MTQVVENLKFSLLEDPFISITINTIAGNDCDTRSQDISSHGIDLDRLEYSSSSSRRDRNINLHTVNNVTFAVASAWDPGPHLNIKTVLSTYGDFHVKDKTAVRTSYL